MIHLFMALGLEAFFEPSLQQRQSITGSAII